MGRQFLWRLKELQAGLDQVGGLERRAGPLRWGGAAIVWLELGITTSRHSRFKKVKVNYNLFINKDIKTS